MNKEKIKRFVVVFKNKNMTIEQIVELIGKDKLISVYTNKHYFIKKTEQWNNNKRRKNE